jgi:ApeA N-terminal domain 1
VSLAMDRVACIEAVTLFHPDLVDERPNGPPARLPIEMFARWADRAAWVEPKDLPSRDVLFHYHVIGADGLGQLLDAAARYRAELRRVIATRREGRMYNSDRLLNRCAALESFDRQRREPTQCSFKDRITACINFAGEQFERIVNDTETWLRVLKQRRNHVAHHLENDDEDDGFTDLVMADSTYFLFALCFLREAGMPLKVFDLIEDNGRVDWVRRRLSGVLNKPHTELSSAEYRESGHTGG